MKEGVASYVSEQEIPGIDAKFIEILSICVFSRREELRKVLTELVLQQAIDKHLVDYNYNVELCLSSDTMMRVNESMLVLELFLRGTDGKDLERVIIEMNKVEAKAFVTKLKEIEKVNFYHPNHRIGGSRIQYPTERLNICLLVILIIKDFNTYLYHNIKKSSDSKVLFIALL